MYNKKVNASTYFRYRMEGKDDEEWESMQAD